ncbi:AraC family transcriptional regulator [Paenibacillus allorhizosphaerae]|uniref:Arabinose operon regulatory protein n=1 Tax=Paenibacillus allorhizosphaerae TaxID=2849866 RepID=A0ABM8VCP1_9BACL|nr:AraC family transcriptional regulator [Paenibacillus allorhizosphaerae]CAG7624658.1 Arabinose operon regulatory protein [Paenibacillus allorhizosphaerae]
MSRKGFRNSSHPLGSQIDLNFYYCGKEDCKPGHDWGPGIRDHFKFHYIHSGEGILKVGDSEFRLRQGQGFFTFPHAISYYKADENKPWTYSWIAFQGLQAESYLKRAHLTTTRPVMDFEGNPWFETIFDQLMEARQAERSCDLKYQGILYRFLSEVIDTACKETEPRADVNYSELYVRKAIEYIEINFSHKVSIAELADYIGVDRKYLSALFKKKLSLSPQAFLLQFRMNKAGELMRNSNLTIADISRSVGYSDPLLFSKMFKKMTGLSPKTYRKQAADS